MGRTQGKRVWHSRPLLEVVLRDQPFVYHSPDHPVLQPPLPSQHPPSLEKFLLQLLQGRKMLIMQRPRTTTRDPRTRRLWPIDPISGRTRELRDASETKTALPHSHRSGPVDLSSRTTHGCAALPA